MSSNQSNNCADAVFFFDRGTLQQQMLLVEFEAALDGVVTMPDCAGRTVDATFVRIRPGLRIEGAVFFRIDFDADGVADPRWNLPLEQLYQSGAVGPDMGQGPVRICCRSRCSLAWYRAELWDPDFSRSTHELVQLARAVRENRLGLGFSSEPGVADGAIRAHFDAEERAQMRSELDEKYRAQAARVIRDQKLAFEALQSRQKEEVGRLRKQHRDEVEDLEQQLDSHQEALQQEMTSNQQLKEKLRQQAVEIKRLNAELEAHLESIEVLESEGSPATRERMRLEAQAAVQTELSTALEALNMREMELAYAREHRERLEARLRTLEQSQVRAAMEVEAGLLPALRDKGIALMAYQPGAGHFSLEPEEVAEYLQDPTRVAAARCGLSVQRYQQWLDHHEDPCCQAQIGDSVCAMPVPRVDVPAQFDVGFSDRCLAHQSTPIAKLA